ncbi:hypothetical protein KFK09_023150 [Dendrobium nobile]|uniref:Uncharacterized protein n=1 Tax=Dendrobium nobile TaxID=94219 RepID=A0A8T3AJT6_DENNO|nr:hypothetical protein KFK09_023150 [Dendrobium nobile]
MKNLLLGRILVSLLSVVPFIIFGGYVMKEDLLPRIFRLLLPSGRLNMQFKLKPFFGRIWINLNFLFLMSSIVAELWFGFLDGQLGLCFCWGCSSYGIQTMMRGTNIWLPGWFSSLGWPALRLMMFFVTWKLIFSTAGSQEVLPSFGGLLVTVLVGLSGAMLYQGMFCWQPGRSSPFV